MNIRLITFDLDHTLWDPDDAIREGERASHAWLAQQVPAFGEQFSPQAFVDLRVQLWQQQPSLKHRVSDIRRVAFRQALQTLGLSEQDAQALAEEAFAVFWQARQRVRVFPETDALLAALAAHYTLGALSNGNACLKAIGLAHHFRFHFAGEHFAAAKPAPDMFIAALEQTGVPAQQALHIGDHPVDDIQGAQAVGMKTLWVNLAGKAWPAEQTMPDYTVSNLRQISALLLR